MGLLADDQSTTNEPTTTIDRIGAGSDPASSSLSGLLSRSTPAKDNKSTTTPTVAAKAKPQTQMSAVECNLYADVARILMSLLHGWTLDNGWLFDI